MRFINNISVSQIVGSLILISVLVQSTLNAQEKLIWPVDAQPALTSSFCEYRPGHFHSGIDLKVYGQMNVPCLAVTDGSVSRVKVSTNGYGRALYLTLTDGRTAVYAHLNGFAPEIEELILQRQHESRTYDQEIYFTPADSLSFKQGEIVAFSGRSGTRFPHVHFELRDALQRPLNPLLGDYQVADHIAPTPRSIALIPLDGLSTIEGDQQPRIYNHLIVQHDGIARPGDPIGVTGRIGISVDVFDRADAAENILDIYVIELFINDSLAFKTEFDRFDFTQTSLIELERDYMLKQRKWGTFHRLYQVPGNELPFHRGGGVISRDAQQEAPDVVKIIVSDASGNFTEIEVILVSDQLESESRGVGGQPLISFSNDHLDPSPIEIHILNKYLRITAPPGFSGFNLSNHQGFSLIGKQTAGGTAATWTPDFPFTGKLSIEALDHAGQPVLSREVALFQVVPQQDLGIDPESMNIRIKIPESGVYDTTWVRIIPEPRFQIPDWVESVYRVEPHDQPLAEKARIFITRPDSTVEHGWGIYYYHDKRGWIFMDQAQESGAFSSSVLSWEIFGLVRDVDNPLVQIRYPSANAEITNKRPRFSAQVSDSTSGLSADGLTMKIDGELVPAEYDPPVDRFVYQTWRELSLGSHSLELTAVDRVGNTTRKSVIFKIIP